MPTHRGASYPNGLTQKEHAFVVAYVGRAKGNGTRAAKLAGYKGDSNTLRNAGSRLLAKASVKALVDELRAKSLSKAIMDVDECKTALTTIARTKRNAPKDKVSAIDKLLRTHGAYLDRSEQTINVNVTFKDEEAAALSLWMRVKDDPRVVLILEEYNAP